MGININNTIAYMVGLMNKGITYSMYGARDGSDGTGDCSGTIVRALEQSGAKGVSWLFNTDSMHNFLLSNGFKLVYENNSSYSPKRGDIFIWGKRGQSGGSAGHTGIFFDDKENIIHCNYGFNGVTINNVDQIARANGFPYYYIYRLENANNGYVPKPQTPLDKVNLGSLDKFKVVGNRLQVGGWHIAYKNREMIILIDDSTGKEIARTWAKGVSRPDVKKAYPDLPEVDMCGFDVSFDVPKGKRVRVIARTTNSKDGNTDYIDMVFTNKLTVANTGFSKGAIVTVQNHATHWETGQPIPQFVKGQKYEIMETKTTNHGNPKRAYLLKGVMSWVLEQDIK